MPRDIVDTEPYNGNVWKMLLGSVNDWLDDDDSGATVEEISLDPNSTTVSEKG